MVSNLPLQLLEEQWDVQLISHPGYLAKDFVEGENRMLFETALEMGKPDILVLCLGTNDLGYGFTSMEVIADLQALTQMAIDRYSISTIILCKVHIWNKHFNDLLEQTMEPWEVEVNHSENAKRTKPISLGVCSYLAEMNRKAELHKDGLHLNDVGKGEFAYAIQREVEKIMEVLKLPVRAVVSKGSVGKEIVPSHDTTPTTPP